MPTHILNGDALLERFPVEIEGRPNVCRECLMDGEVKAQNPSDFFSIRSKYLSQTYGGTVQDYYKHVVPEIEAISKLPAKEEVNLWFEEDLFCQINLWFICSLLKPSQNVYLVMPLASNPYSFGHLSKNELLHCYHKKRELKELSTLQKIWEAYTNKDLDSMYSIAKSLKESHPFILSAVQAHSQRLSPNSYPEILLKNLKLSLNTEDFARVFHAFSKQAPQYGYGDLQVKRMWDSIQNT